MQGAVTGEDRDWLRDWSARFVRGAGPLPSLLVGPQPYGVLPVTLVAPEIVPAGNVQHVEDVLGELLGSWQASLPNVPHLDPDATDAPPARRQGRRTARVPDIIDTLPGQVEDEADLAAVASQVLGAVPHPTAFRLAHVDDHARRPTRPSSGDSVARGPRRSPRTGRTRTATHGASTTPSISP